MVDSGIVIHGAAWKRAPLLHLSGSRVLTRELGFATVRMVNGGTGIRGGDCLPEPKATGFPSTPASAATFNPELNRQLGDVLGDEARRHGHQVLLAPGMNTSSATGTL